MNRRKAVPSYHFIMELCAITLVFLKTILGKFFMKPQHFGVARFFGDDRSGGDKRNLFVSFDNCFLIIIFWREKRAVQ